MTGQHRRSAGWIRPLPGMLLALALLLPSLAAAAPTTLLFEGYLRSAGGGAAADGNYQVSFALYDSDKAVQDFWQEGPVTVAVTNGQFAYALGTSKALESDMLAAKGTAWMQVKVGNDPALPKQKLHTVPFAAYAMSAGGLSCSGCVNLTALKMNGDLDLGGNALKASSVVAPKVQAGAITASTVQSGTVSAQKFIGDGSALTGVGIAADSCPAGKVVSGIDQAGKMICVTTAGSLPPDGLKNISNGVLSNNFIDKIASAKVPIPIPDNNPVGVADTIDVPDLGTAEDLTVSINVSNSKLDALEVTIYDPNNDKYLLWNKDKPGTNLTAVYPKPTATLSGDLTKWIGKNPKGKWRIHVIDHAFKDNQADGAINAWSINLHTLSDKKVQLNGDLVLTGKIISGGGASGATYRWAKWSTYTQAHGTWFAGNNAALFGGVAPSTWSGNGRASQMSSTTSVLRALFVHKGPKIGTLKDATVWSEEWRGHSSNVSRHAAALFRVRNNTGGAITWKPYWYATAYGGWGEVASIAINGSEVYQSGGDNRGPQTATNHDISIPASRTSTVIFVVGSSSASSDMRSLFLSFYNNCLTLPNGLEFVDDLDTKPDGWNN